MHSPILDAIHALQIGKLKYSLFLRHFLLLFWFSSCYNPFEIQIIPSPFPATKARDAQGEHF
jgi:hypothetical protein